MANRGRTIEMLDENNNIIYPRTSANQVLYGNNGRRIGQAMGDAEANIETLRTDVTSIQKEVSDARNSQTVNYPTLDARLDAIDSSVSNINNVTKEVEEKQK